jgi:chorismate mutase/prephenate dehydratase
MKYCMNIEELRQNIDSIDNEISRLFTERMHIASQIAEYKREHNMPVLDQTREREIISRITGNQSDEVAAYSKMQFTTLFDLSRSYQNRRLTKNSEISQYIRIAAENTPKLFPAKATVACQGREGAYSQIACDKLFSFPSIMYMESWQGVFQAVDKNLCRYGILPIENSLHGTVSEVYDLMKKYKFYVARSVKLQIHHYLLTKNKTELSEIREIFSHEQAIGQCAEFLSGLKNVKITICENTAVAAKIVSDSPRNDIAAISSKSCAELYGLTIAADKIQDNDNNYTRFICISKELEIYPGANKISLMFTISHKPGSLYNLIAKFSALGLNLTKLESRPIPGMNFEFMFYFDLEANICSDDVISLISELENGPEEFVFMGSYSEI